MKWWLVFFCGFVALLTSCGADQEPETQSEAVAQPAEQVLASPLEAQLGFSSEPGRRQFQLIGMQEQADATIVECMRNAGFFYAVGRSEDRFRAGSFAGDGSRTWVEANGLGVTTSFIDALLADEASEVVNDAVLANQEFVDSLTALEATAYDTALVGDVIAEPTGEFVPAGCWGLAYTDVVRVFSLIDEFRPDLDSLNSRLVSDPRFLSFQQQWSTCMDAVGHRYPNEQAMVDDVYARLLEIELIEVAGATRVSSQSVLDELQVFERDVATASFDCRLVFADDATRLRIDYEQEFLDDNRFRLAELAGPS